MSDVTYEAACEVRDAIGELTKELKLIRLAITAMHKTFEGVIDEGAGSYPGFIRVRNEQ